MGISLCICTCMCAYTSRPIYEDVYVGYCMCGNLCKLPFIGLVESENRTESVVFRKFVYLKTKIALEREIAVT